MRCPKCGSISFDVYAYEYAVAGFNGENEEWSGNTVFWMTYIQEVKCSECHEDASELFLETELGRRCRTDTDLMDVLKQDSYLILSSQTVNVEEE